MIKKDVMFKPNNIRSHLLLTISRKYWHLV